MICVVPVTSLHTYHGVFCNILDLCRVCDDKASQVSLTPSVRGARFEIHRRPEANAKMRTWRAEPNQRSTLTQCSVSDPPGDEVDCIVQQSTAPGSSDLVGLSYRAAEWNVVAVGVVCTANIFVVSECWCISLTANSLLNIARLERDQSKASLSKYPTTPERVSVIPRVVNPLVEA